MHFAENRTDEGIAGVGMEFAGAPLILIGHTDNVAYTTTTALLRTVETFFHPLVNGSGNVLPPIRRCGSRRRPASSASPRTSAPPTSSASSAAPA
jgi:hypothetical protein